MSADFTTIFVVTAFCSVFKTKWKGGIILQYRILMYANIFSNGEKRYYLTKEHKKNVSYHLQVDAVFSKSRGWRNSITTNNASRGRGVELVLSSTSEFFVFAFFFDDLAGGNLVSSKSSSWA